MPQSPAPVAATVKPGHVLRTVGVSCHSRIVQRLHFWGSYSRPPGGLAGVVHPQSSVVVFEPNGNLTKSPVILVVVRFYVSFVEENGRIFYSR